MTRLINQIGNFILLFLVAILPSFAAEGTWRQYFEVGTKTMHYSEIAAKMKSFPKEERPKNIEKVMYSISSRESIKKAGKYLRAVFTIFRKGETDLPTSAEMDDLAGAMSVVWRNEQLEVQDMTLNKTPAEKLEANRKLQEKISQDNSVLADLAIKVGKQSKATAGK